MHTSNILLRSDRKLLFQDDSSSIDLVIEEEPVNLVFETDSSEATGIRGLLADCP